MYQRITLKAPSTDTCDWRKYVHSYQNDISAPREYDYRDTHTKRLVWITKNFRLADKGGWWTSELILSPWGHNSSVPFTVDGLDSYACPPTNR